MSRHRITYPGLADPRAALERLRDAYDYALKLEQCFAVQSPWRKVLAEIPDAMRKAAAEATGDPHFFGGKPCGQSVYQPPPATPLPGEPSGKWPPR